MKFLIQKINKEIVHDFSFVLRQSIDYQNWLYNKNNIICRYANCESNQDRFDFKSIYRHYVPVGSVEFVCAFMKHFFNLNSKPLNVPECLFKFANRKIFNGTNRDIIGLKFVKSNDFIKAKKANSDESLTDIYNEQDAQLLPNGNYQISDVIDIKSEYRCFIYRNTLEGIHYYSGDFTFFPNINIIRAMIQEYSTTCPIAYTLDIGVNMTSTFPIEAHDFFSCGLYGFANHNIYPQMLYRWFKTFVDENLNKKIWKSKYTF